jgi:hypothetical protein
MKLANSTYEHIKEEVVALFEELDIRCIPISGFEIAHKMGLKLIPYSALSEEDQERARMIDPDGFFTDYGGRETIMYNDNVKYARANMTILHEIGHCVLGHTNEMDQEVAEAEARFFAKYAAAPPPLVHMIKPRSEHDIVQIFNISKQASVHAYDYYKKWLKEKQRETRLKRYEINLLTRFQEAYSGLRS